MFFRDFAKKCYHMNIIQFYSIPWVSIHQKSFLGHSKVIPCLFFMNTIDFKPVMCSKPTFGFPISGPESSMWNILQLSNWLINAECGGFISHVTVTVKYEDGFWERSLRGGLLVWGVTLFLWRSEFTQKHAQSTGNHTERLWKKNLDQKFDLTQKLEQFSEKKMILLRIPM